MKARIPFSRLAASTSSDPEWKGFVLLSLIRRVLFINILLATALIAGANSSSVSAYAIKAQDSGKSASEVPRVTPLGDVRLPIGQISWTPCGTGVDCGRLTVPLDYAKPRNGKTATLALMRLRHNSHVAPYQGVMVLAPGGPGEPGLWLTQFVPRYLSPKAAAAYDWIGFDQRGVDHSIPRLSCDPTYASAMPRPAYVPATHEILEKWLQRSKAYARSCAKKYGAALQHFGTLDTAHDLESIRLALHQEKLSLYGFSYGTYSSQVYASLYPGRVRRMVLDSVVDATRVFHQSNLDQDIAFQIVIDKFFSWIASYDRVYHLGKTRAEVQSKWDETLATLAAHPAGGLIGPAELSDAVLAAGYSQRRWPVIASGWADWVALHDDISLTTIYVRPQDDNVNANYLATECLDAPWPRSWADWWKENTQLHRVAPFTTWLNAWFNAPCAWWQVKTRQQIHVGSKDVPPFLLISQTLDAATPYSGALRARALFPQARLLAVVGGTNHAWIPDEIPCVDDRVNIYLIEGRIASRKPGNKADIQCSPNRLPIPYELGS